MNQIDDPARLHDALPAESTPMRVGADEVGAALRAPGLDAATANLHRLIGQEGRTNGPRLEDLTGDTAALRAVRRLVTDLRA